MSQSSQQQQAHFAKEIQHVFEEYRIGVKPQSFSLETSDKVPPNTFKVGLLEDIWLTIHLNNSGFLILKVEIDPNAANPSLAKAAYNEARPHVHAPFESMDGLLNSVSGEYRAKFQERLYHKLEKVAREREREEQNA